MSDSLTVAQRTLERARRETDRAMRAARRLRLNPVAAAQRVGVALAAERAAWEGVVAARRVAE